MPGRRFPPPWVRRGLDACFVLTDSAEGGRPGGEPMSIKLLRHELLGIVLCLMGTDYINSANAQQTDQETIVTKAEAAN